MPGAVAAVVLVHVDVDVVTELLKRAQTKSYSSIQEGQSIKLPRAHNPQGRLSSTFDYRFQRPIVQQHYCLAEQLGDALPETDAVNLGSRFYAPYWPLTSIGIYIHASSTRSF